MYKAEEITFTAGDKVGKVSGLFILPKGAEALLVLAHGAGRGDAAQVHGGGREEIGGSFSCDLTLSVSLHGKGDQKTGLAKPFSPLLCGQPLRSR